MKRRHVMYLTLLTLGATFLLPTPSLTADKDGTPTGELEGVVRFTGKPPAPRKLATTDGTLLHRDLIIDGKTKGLRDVVASLMDAPAQPKLKGVEPIYMDQRDLLFVPRVLSVQQGRAVRFDNSDSCNHSVLALSTTKANSFNVFVPTGKPVDHTFVVQKHPVQIGCSLHAWMRAWIYVFDHPWFAQSDAKGTFRIKKIPPGKYTLLLRHADTGLQEKRPVEIKAGTTTRLEVKWDKVEQ